MIEEKKYVIPNTVVEAVEMAVSHAPKTRYIAGGTDLITNIFHDNETSEFLIDITGLTELKGVSRTGEFLRIGSLETLAALKRYPEITEEFSMLQEAAQSVGSPLLRKTATIGGNILCENRCLFYNQAEWWRESAGYCLKCNGDICIATQGKNGCFSELVSDTAPALIAMDAQVEMIDGLGRTQIQLENIYSGDGVKPHALQQSTLITAILLPLNRGFRTCFRKLRERETLEYTSLTTAVSVDKVGKIKVVLGGVDPKPVVVEAQRGGDMEALIVLATKRARAVENVMYSRTYRKKMIRVFLEKSFSKLQINN